MPAKTNRPVLKLVTGDSGFGPWYSAEPGGLNQVMFNHLWNDDEHTCHSLGFLKSMAELHGWDVKVRKVRKDEMDDGGG